MPDVVFGVMQPVANAHSTQCGEGRRCHLQVRQETPLGLDIGMADFMADLGGLGGQVATA